MNTESKKTKFINNNKEKLVILLVFAFIVLIFLTWVVNLNNRIRDIESFSVSPEGSEYKDIMKELDGAISEMSQSVRDSGQGVKENIELEKDNSEIIESEEQGNFDIILPPKNLNNCPAYINCMPTIGVARPCVIPPGCEEFTQIVY